MAPGPKTKMYYNFPAPSCSRPLFLSSSLIRNICIITVYNSLSAYYTYCRSNGRQIIRKGCEPVVIVPLFGYIIKRPAGLTHTHTHARSHTHNHAIESMNENNNNNYYYCYNYYSYINHIKYAYVLVLSVPYSLSKVGNLVRNSVFINGYPKKRNRRCFEPL